MFGKKEYKEAASATAFLGLGAAAWVIILVILSIVATSGWLLYQKWYINKNTEIMRQTNQYITTQQTMLNTWANEYRMNEINIAAIDNAETIAALKAQNRVMCDQMSMAAQRIPAEYVPAEAKAILAGGCK